MDATAPLPGPAGTSNAEQPESLRWFWPPEEVVAEAGFGQR